MARITLELLRRRAEHNEGCLSTLKELALHQQDLERIELLGDYCRQLEILYLCNNYIAAIEGLRHLKALTYLNLAVNNITVIDGLDGCESLARLDLTLNFVADVTCVRRLQANAHLSELHLTGNPCTQTPGYRAFVVHALPQLRELDGSEVTRSERVVARQDEDEIATRAADFAAREQQQQCEGDKAAAAAAAAPRYNDKGERVYGHSPAERLQMLRDEEERKRAQEEARAQAAPGSLAALRAELTAKPPRLTPEEEIAKHGRLLMRNEAKVPFTVCDDDDDVGVVVTVQPGKYLSTTLLDVQVDVRCIRVYIKGKLLQLPVDRELAVAAATVQRSTTTGELKITVPLAADAPRRGRRRGGAAVAANDKADCNCTREGGGGGSGNNGSGDDTKATTAARTATAAAVALPSRSELRICATAAAAAEGEDSAREGQAATSDTQTQHTATTASKARVTVLCETTTAAAVTADGDNDDDTHVATAVASAHTAHDMDVLD